VLLIRRLNEQISAASIVWFRIAFGGLMVIDCARYPLRGWVHDYWIEPAFHFKYYGFEWVEPWPGAGMIVHFVALTILAGAIMVGYRYRIAAALFTLGITYVFLLDQSRYLNHSYAIILFAGLLALTPAEGDASLDARRDPMLRSSSVPRWSLWAIRAQMGFIYFWAGIAKLNADWFHGQPLTLWLQGMSSMPDVLKGDAGLYLSWAGAAFDLLIVPCLLWRRTRAAALVIACLFHLVNSWTFDIGMFPWISIAATLLFLEPDHPLFRTMLRGLRLDAAPRVLPTSAPVAAVLSLWLVSQVTVPLRPFLYPTNVHWSEDGHRFSWHMMLRSKEATGTFLIRIPGRRRVIHVDPNDELGERRAHKMLIRPDMILQFAHHLAGQHKPDAEVYAHVLAALNGRPAARLIDDRVDLAREPRTLWPASWVLPFENTPIPAAQ
jgi:hypothetical protein